MRDFNRPIRKAVYELLNGQLSYGNSSVPIFDEKVKKGVSQDYYVIIGSISSTDDSTFSTWTRDISIVLDVVTKTTDTVSRNIADSISGQILALIMPSIGSCGLTQAFFQYLNCKLMSDRYLDLQLNPTTAMVRRLLTFSITTNQTS